jgi:hypothetical protein
MIFLYISKSYRRLVLKIGLVIGLIIAMGAMLVMPSPVGHLAKASNCSIMFAVHGTQFSSRSTLPGGCSVGTATSQMNAKVGVGGAITHNPDIKSTCVGASSSFTQSGLNIDESSGAVSCSSHSP